MTKPALGLDPPRPGDPFEGFLSRILGQMPFIEEGRATFEALVPDRFKPTKDRT
jgi:hypothetical protein